MADRTIRALHPGMPEGTVWQGPFLNHSGFGDEMRGFVTGLRQRGVQVAARAYAPSQRYIQSLTTERRAVLDAALQEPALEHAIHVFHGPAGAVRRTGGAYHIARTMFETDALHPSWIGDLNSMDEVWVASSFNVETFRRAGVTVPLHVVPSGVDPQEHRPGLAPLELDGVSGTVFLSVFGWAHRKGWDVLLRSWVKAFSRNDDVTLLLRTYPQDDFDGQQPADEIDRRINTYLRKLGTSRRQAAPIVVVSETLSDEDMPRLYATADAFVLPTRGEGWGRPFLEAMSSGLPVLGTRWGSQLDFLTDANSYLIDIDGLERIGPPEQVTFFHGQQWARPSSDHLAQLLQQVVQEPEAAATRGRAARADVLERWTWAHSVQAARTRIEQVHEALRPPRTAAPTAPAVRWVGDQWSVHSLAIVNRELCSRLASGGVVDLETESYEQFSVSDSETALARTAGPVLGRPAEVEVRHQWPPNWTPPESGAWVAIQPWEFGGLPDSWLPALRHQVDEVWCYSSYVRDVYLRSGVPAELLRVIPLGVDAQLFRPDGPAYPLRTRKSFKILFVGGAIARKGIDVLLDAYLSTFTATDDVCLVLKTAGAASFYRGTAQDARIAALAADPATPELELVDAELTAEQVAALYRSCDLLVHPYRGEGFGLPVAEAMAAGLPVVVTDQGACSDFCDDETALLIPSQVVPVGMGDVGPSTAGYEWAEPDQQSLGAILKAVHADGSEARTRAERARARILNDFRWDQSVAAIQERCLELSQRVPRRNDGASGATRPASDAGTGTDPNSIAAARQQAESLYASDDIVAAGKLLVDVNRRFPGDPGILSDLGVVSLGLGKPEEALSLFDQALALAPGDEDAVANHQDALATLSESSDWLPVAQAHLARCTWTRDSRPPLRLNVGAGDDRREGYLSIDLREDTADVVADVRALPFPDGAVEEVMANDVLEHFWRDHTAGILAEWRRVLRVGGTLRVKVPNMLALAQHIDGPYHDSIVENIYGGHRWGPDGAYDTHHWGWSPRTIQRDLAAAGFDVVENDQQLNMTVIAHRR